MDARRVFENYETDLGMDMTSELADVENKNKEDVQVINESDNDDVDEVMAMAKELMEG